MLPLFFSMLFHYFHDDLMANIWSICEREDSFLFNKCLKLCDLHVRPDHFGTNEEYSVPIYAAVSNLSHIFLYSQ